MQLTTLATAIVGMSAMASAMPTEMHERMAKLFTDAGYNVTSSGVYSPSLGKRAEIPPACSFEGRAGDFSYQEVTGGDFETCCVGWTGTDCGAGGWDGADFEDAQTALATLATKDGQLEDAEVGNWIATFFLGTSAFSNRNTTPFGLVFATVDTKWTTFYFSLDGDYATLSYNSGFCPSE